MLLLLRALAAIPGGASQLPGVEPVMDPRAEPPSEPELRALQARMELRSGELALTGTIRDSRVGDQGTQQVEFQQRIAFSGSSVWYTWKNSVPRPAGPAREVQWLAETVVRTDVFFGSYPAFDGDEAGRKSVAAQTYGDGFRDRVEHLVQFDPLSLGLTTTPYCGTSVDSRRSIVGRADRTNTQLTSGRIGDDDFDIVRYSTRSGLRVSIWFCRSHGGALTKAEVTDGARIDSLEAEVSAVEGTNSHFPTRVVTRALTDGRVTYECEVIVESARFNLAIDEERFGVAGLMLPKGTMVLELPNPPGPTRMWDGEKLVPIRRSDLASSVAFETLPNDIPGYRWSWLAVSVGLLVAAVGVVLWFRRRL
jgi:hypothetical protein